MTLITRNATSAQVMAAFANGGTIDFERDIKIVCSASSHISPPIKEGTIINGNGATLEFQMNNAADAANRSKPWIALKINNGVTINSLNLKGRMAYEVMGSNITVNNCKVDQSSPFPDKYNALASGLYACFLIRSTGSHHVTFNACEAWYADHMGFAVWNGGGTFNCYEIKWLKCKAMHCGSGWETSNSTPGHNPWGRGFDVLEDLGVVKFVAEDCCAYDCLQSGFYNEGEYISVDANGKSFMRNSKPQGVYRNCHAENCGIRIAEAAIANRNLIGNIPWPNGVKSGKPDVYGDGFYCLGAGITVENCTSKNNLSGFSIESATVNGFQDEGSWIGGQSSGGLVKNATFIKPKYFAFAWWNKLRGGSSIRIIDPPGSRPPVLGTWFTMQGQRCLHPNSYSKVYVDNDNVLSTKWNGSRYLKLSEHKPTYWNGYSGNTDGLTIQINKSEYATPSACVRSFRGGSSNTSNVSVTYNPSMTYTPIGGCGNGGIVDPPPIVTPVCNPGDIDCVNKKKCQADAMGNVMWVDVSVDDPVYVSRCDPDAECVGKEIQCIGGREHVCSNGKLIFTGKTCTDTLVPYAGRPELKQGTVTKIYARDFAKGDNGKAYMDTTPGNNLGNSTYRTDTTGVDLVQWDARMVEPESNKTVVAYTETGEWLKYPVKVTTSGTYTITFRASTGVASSKIIVSIDGGDKTTIDIPVTSADYSVFQSFEGTVVAPYVSDNSTIKVEFIGDMNLLWFTCSWLNNYGGRDPLPTQLPVASFTTDKISGVMPLVVQFTDTSTGNPTVWMWDFGDGSSSSDRSPTHTYTTPGTYLVKLTITNQSGTTTSPATSITVTATGLAPVADFTMDVTEGAPPLTVHFTDTSTNNPTSWFWNFDDGSTSTEQNPTHIFTYDMGNFTVRLFASNAYGSNLKSFNYIVTRALKPTVDFIANKTSGICPFTVQFNATSSAPTATYAWDFGDGETSTEKDPMHTYTSTGKYTVTLTVTADGQTGNKIRHNYITVAEPVSIPPPPIENPVEMTQLPYNTFVLRNEYGYICYISAEWYDHGGEGKAYHNVLNGTPYTYRRGTDALELLDDSIITSTGEWVEYTISVADSSYYYMRLETKNTDPQARIKADVVDLSDRVMYTLFDMAVPVTGNEFVKYDAKTDIAKKFMFVQSEYTTIRFTFTGNFNFKSVSIMSSDTIEGKVNSASYISPVPNIAILPFTINPYQFDKGGQGISYMDTTEERFVRKPIRDTDVDLITVGFGDSTIETLVTGTVKGEWVQYTINNTTTNEYTDATLDIECSTTEPLSKLQIVFINENDAKTYDEYRQYSNSYIVSPPLTKTFTQVSKLSLPVKIYNGKNIMRIYFDDNISLGQMTFRT